MAINNRIGTKVHKNLRREEATATRVDPHPYIGIVKNNLDPTRAGRLQVWIPDFGGDQDDSTNWRTVGYGSPFMGTTTTEVQSPLNNFKSVPHTYGMWMVPPDIGVEVIVLFIAGDPRRGYWIACVNSNLSRHMLPGLASSPSIVNENGLPITAGQQVPVVEFNELDPSVENKQTFYDNQKPVHTAQYEILKIQGLDRDTTRGTITSSSQRESPSTVFGISTPGRPYFNDPADDPAYLDKLAKKQIPESSFRYLTRAGGHTFVMDDGSIIGKDQLIRLRTAGGHQLMMNDSENVLYISHADGNSWLEFSASGAVNIFTNNGFNVRSKGTINFHSDRDINFNAASKLNFRAGSTCQIDAGTINLTSAGKIATTSTGQTEIKASEFNVDAASKISVLAGGKLALNGSAVTIKTDAGKVVNAVSPIALKSLSDTSKNGELYVSAAGTLSTIVTVAPTHEPFEREVTQTAPVTQTVEPTVTYKEGYDAIKNVAGTTVKTPAGDKELRDQPMCDCQIGNLTSDQLTAYYAQIGKSESGGKYDIVNTIGFVGKYQFGYMALIDLGYVKRTCTSNAKMNNPNNWTGKNGVNSLSDFLANHSEQENAMCAYTKSNYKTMSRIGAISKDADSETIGGMLAVSHLLGAGGAKKWRNGGGGADQYGTTGETYFQKGKYAIAVLAPKLPGINAG